jgi:hypothetical protein
MDKETKDKDKKNRIYKERSCVVRVCVWCNKRKIRIIDKEKKRTRIRYIYIFLFVCELNNVSGIMCVYVLNSVGII